MSSRTEIFEQEVYDILCKHGPLRMRDILSLVQDQIPALVQDQIPDWCTGDWEHDVHNAQQVLKKNRKLIVSEPLPERPSWYRWKAVEL